MEESTASIQSANKADPVTKMVLESLIEYTNHLVAMLEANGDANYTPAPSLKMWYEYTIAVLDDGAKIERRNHDSSDIS